MRLLILGGYGSFGGRLVEMLVGNKDLELIVAGRSGAKAENFCKTLKGLATLTAKELDRNDIAAALETLEPDIVIDASGPFQIYGRDPYMVVKACLAARIDYLDLADSREFVVAISKFDDDAKHAGVTILSGVSTVPVLSSAAIAEIGADMRIERVSGGIAPSPHINMGRNVIRAIISYAGGPVNLIRNGQPTIARGLTESRRYTIAPPGYLPLPNIHFSLIDVPDLQLLPALMPSLADIWFGAGSRPEILQRMLNLTARLRAALHLPKLDFLVPLMLFIVNRLKLGEHRGGMYIELHGVVGSGQSQEKQLTRSWHLIAEGDDGPYIPSMAIAALISKWRAGKRPEIGARPAIGALTLADFQPLFDGKAIDHGIRETGDDAQPIFQQLLGEAFMRLPPALRKLHGGSKEQRWHGEAQVVRGNGWIAGLVARRVGFPHAAASIPVTVDIMAGDGTSRNRGDGETWVRNFGGTIFKSHLTLGHGCDQYLMAERFGPITVLLAIVWQRERLYFIPRQWRLWNIRLPKCLLPSGDSFECEADGRFQFNVRIAAPIIGLIVQYRGALTRID